MIAHLEIQSQMSSILEVKMELPYNQMFVKKNVETEDISIKMVVMMVIGITGTDATDNVMSNLVGSVLEGTKINNQFVLRFAGMVSI